MPSRPTARQPDLRSDQQIMSSSEIERTLVRLAHEIIEKNDGAKDLGLVGIRKRGAPLAHRLVQMIQRIEKTSVAVGSLDITLYRDDLSPLGPKPVVQKTEVGFSVSGKNIILVDDVLYTGRTTRAAMDALFSQGRPKRVQLCALSTVAIVNCRLRLRSSEERCIRQGSKLSKCNCPRLTTARGFFYSNSMTRRRIEGGAGTPVRARRNQ